MPILNTDIKKSIKVILGVCLVCSFFVSTSAVMLNSVQEKNRRLDRITHILKVSGLYERSADIEQIYQDHIEPVMIDLASGKRINKDRFDDVLNIKNFDIKTLATSPEYGEDIPAKLDRAKIKRRPKFMAVYPVKSEQRLHKLVLPIYGKGLWSTLYGFLALSSDLDTIAGITFYEHGETPGLGGEIDNPKWKRSWQGKKAFDDDGDVIIEVVRGEADTESSEADHQIDGLSGATLTSRGVNNLVRYWLGEHGYGPFLTRLRQGSLEDLAYSDEPE